MTKAFTPSPGQAPGSVRLAAALRDFFMARDSWELACAVQAVAEASGRPSPPGAGLEQTEFAFNRLFVGPMALEAPPYASVYLEPEPLVMGVTTLEVRGAYHALGLASRLEGRLPDDHVGLELDCAAALRTALDREPGPGLADLHARFVAGHMAAWIPAFAQRISAAPSAHPVTTYCANQLVRWLDQETAAAQGAA